MSAIQNLKPLNIAVKPKKEKEEAGYRSGLLKRGKFYHYRFTVNGDLFTGSTKQEKLANAKIELARQRQKANHTVKGTPYNPLLSELITEWEVTQRSKNHSEKHIANCSRLFKAHVYPIITDLKIGDFTDKHIEKIKTEYNKEHTGHGCNTLLTYIKCILYYGKKNYHVEIPDVEKMNPQKKPVTYLDMDEIDTFLDEIDFKGRTTLNGAIIPVNVQISFAVRVMIYMGFRENEVLGMKRANLNIAKQTYRLDETKGNESPTLDVPDEVMEWVDKLEVNGPYLLHTKDGERHHEGYTSIPIRRASKRMGRNFGPHELRRTHGCMLATIGTEAFTIQKTLRHKSITTSLVYVAVADKVVAEAQAKMRDAMKQNRRDRQKKETEVKE